MEPDTPAYGALLTCLSKVGLDSIGGDLEALRTESTMDIARSKARLAGPKLAPMGVVRETVLARPLLPEVPIDSTLDRRWELSREPNERCTS